MAIPSSGLEWRITDTPVPYAEAVAAMEARVAAIREGTAPELVWLLAHPPVYTAGTSARDEDLLDAGDVPVVRTGRGGQFTFHGPGQRVGYVMLDLRRRDRADLRAFVHDLEAWLIDTLALFAIRGERRDGRVGIWVDRRPYGGLPGTEDKIAAIGVRVRHWVSFHGLSLNASCDLSHFSGIVPCGISDLRYGVTSLRALGIDASMEQVDEALLEAFSEVFAR